MLVGGALDARPGVVLLHTLRAKRQRTGRRFTLTVLVLGVRGSQARYEASAVGINVDPTQLLRRVDPTGPGSTAPRPKLTSKCALAGSVEQFLKLREKQAREPLGAAVCLVHALLNWAEPATREAGRQMLVLAAAEELLVEGSTYKRYALNPELEAALAQALPGAVAAVRSLVAGTAAAVGYAFDPGAVRLAHDAHAEEGQDEKAGVYTVRAR